MTCCAIFCFFNFDFVLLKIESIVPPTPPTVDVPQTPKKKDPPTNTQRVVNDFKKFPKSTIRKRSKRLNLRKSFIRDVKKEKNL